jgi:excisionase family DNA binding protein
VSYPAYPPPKVAVYTGRRADDDLYTPAEVAAMFRVEPKTVSRWESAGKLPCIRTLGGHRRFRASVVHDLLDKRWEAGL